MNRVEAIRERLTSSLAPQSLEIIDDSHRHAGHASAGGGGHFTVSIVSDAFRGQGTLQRHRMVYAALSELMQQNEVHALSIQARTPDEN
ncbi:MAG: BolA family transcriptional regulator [Gammaproteobacteria bacterium HGW-Gammaproteobacteria-1]|jgi:BolA protein|nr:MAG: BolA family transcriptional regulator [Gammaproteobacteria bacterium HGW-Gammaproteobacteria-1]